MKPPPFRYHDPRTVKEVLGLLASLENAKLLAGGQSLMPMLNMRMVLPDALIDLNSVAELSFIRESPSNLEIGAMTRQRDIEQAAVIRSRCPLLHEAIQHVGHWQTRNRGTIGGSLCQLDPAAELVVVASVLDATISVVGPLGSREIPFVQFPLGYMTPGIAPDELLTAIRLPLWSRQHGYAFVEFSRRHGDFALASVAVLMEAAGDGKITRVSLSVGAVGAVPVRLHDVENMILGSSGSPDLFSRASRCVDVEVLDDVHAPGAYRKQLAQVLTRRAMEIAFARAQHGPR
jgi:carbon-monoxide dehydrogenase medium subunit